MRQAVAMELLLIRHAEPLRVVDAEGPADPRLHERGVAQAQRLAAWLAEEELHELVRSTRPATDLRETLSAYFAVGAKNDLGILNAAAADRAALNELFALLPRIVGAVQRARWTP